MKYLSLILLVCAFKVQAQIPDICLSQQDMTIVILGSSTAAGSGPSVSDSAWVNRYRVYMQAINPNNQVVNLAQGGYTTYKSMPTAFVPPAGKPLPDVTKNIDAALAYSPDAVIINYPSNDASNGFGIVEQMGNFDSIVNYAASFGVPVWVCTTQPKTSFSAVGDAIQIGVKDSILSLYGMMAIDFWNGLADANNDIFPAYDADGTHMNDAGHAVLVSRVIGADIPTFLYVPPSVPDYFVYDIYSIDDWYCGGNSEQVGVILANSGIDDGIGYNVTSLVTNLTTGNDSLYTFSFSSGLSTCQPDTIIFNADFSVSGQYKVQSIVSHISDTSSFNDTLTVYFDVTAAPELLALNDTICYGDSALLGVVTSNADTVFWYADSIGSSSIQGGLGFQLPTLTNDTVLYAQAVSGPLVFLDDLDTKQTSTIDWNGVMFDVVGLDNIVLDSLTCRMNTTGSQTVELYYCSGSHIAQATSPANWTLWHTETVTVGNAGDILMLHPSSLPLALNDTIGIYVMMQNAASDISYRWSSNAQTFASQDSTFEVIAGSGSNHNFGGTYFPRIWNGALHAHHGFNPQGQCSSNLVPVAAVISSPTLSLGNDTSLLMPNTLTLNAPGFISYNWSTGDSTSSIVFDSQVAGPGVYNIVLEATNIHGCFVTDTIEVTVLDPTSVAEFSDLNFTVFPNPFGDDLNINVNAENYDLQIVDIHGRLIFDEKQILSSTYTIDLSYLPSGIFIIHVFAEEQSITRKIVKR